MPDTKPRPGDKDWCVSSSKTLFSTPVANLVSSRVQCDRTGKENDFYRFEFSPWVNIVACTAQKELILIRQYRFGTGQIELEIPGGAVNFGEPPLDAGLRELLEETGYAGENARIIGKVCPNPAIQDNLCYTVFVENARKVADPSMDDMEDIKVLHIPEEEVFTMVTSGEIHHGLVLNGLMFYAMNKENRLL